MTYGRPLTPLEAENIVADLEADKDPEPRRFLIGLALGRSNRRTSLIILEKIRHTTKTPYRTLKRGWMLEEKDEPPDFLCSHIERFDIGTRYPAIVERVQQLLHTSPLQDHARLIIDATEAGEPVCKLFDHAGLKYKSVIVSGGDSINDEGTITRIPKRVLVSTLQAVLQSDHFKIAAHDLRETLLQAMMNYQLTRTEEEKDIYAGRNGVDDDMVIAAALAVWLGDRPDGFTIHPSVYDFFDSLADGF